ncbi:MAG TPA: S1 RNA-binding domain-containing protein, partial [Pseudorhodoferax sp.]|nr:S1 RNA-binding domain-containing protein [Pseudorhodoferax sp.]
VLRGTQDTVVLNSIIEACDHRAAANVKVPHIALSLLQSAWAQAQKAHQHILAGVQAALGESASHRSCAPIQRADEDTRASINARAAGSPDTTQAASLVASIDAHPMASAVLIGEVYEATVVELVEFLGVFLEIKPGQEGLLHWSRLGYAQADQITELSVGQKLLVRVLGRNRDGKFETTLQDIRSLSHRAPMPHRTETTA